MGCKIFILACK